MQGAIVFFWQSRMKEIAKAKTNSHCKSRQRKKKWEIKAKILSQSVFLYWSNQKPAVYKKQTDFPEKISLTEKIRRKIELLPVLSIMEITVKIQDCSIQRP